METNSKVKRAVSIYYGFQFFFSLLLWLPIFYEYQKLCGLNDFQIFRIQSIYYIVFCLLEIPTGMTADLFGHRNCCRMGAIVLVLANLFPIFSPTYAGFLVHFLLIALSRSFISGASSAYLYDYLVEHGAPERYKQIEGNARAYGLVGKVVCWAAVGFLMSWHMTLPYSLTALAAMISTVYAFLMPGVKRQAVQVSSAESLGRLQAVFGMLVSTPILLLVMLQGTAIFILGRILQVNLFQPILSSKNVSVTYFGVAMSVMTIFEALGSFRPSLMRKWFSDLNSVFVLTFLMAASLAVIPIVGSWAAIVSLCLFFFFSGLSFPIQRQLMNDVIPDSRYRATLLSVESIIDRALNAWVAALIGDYLQSGNMSSFIELSALWSVGAMAVLILAIRLSASRTQNRMLEPSA